MMTRRKQDRIRFTPVDHGAARCDNVNEHLVPLGGQASSERAPST
jgi:hypothetical protein